MAVLAAVAGPLATACRAQPAAAAAGCDAAPPPPLGFDQARGVRTKWLSLTRDARNTIQPDLEGLPLKQWMANLEALRINLAELNLEPERLLAVRPVYPDAEIGAAAAALYAPQAARSDSDRARIAGFEQHVFPFRLYTPAQRNAVQLDFLRRLEALRTHREIAGSVRFMLHQRLWFRQQAGEPNREARAGQFADDMTSFIRLAESNCLGRWIAGVRLGEHSNNDMAELLPLAVELAARINAGTNGWLKSHLFLVNGGGWGAEYKGVGRVPGPDGRPYPFFARIAAETGGFAFAYKWMQFHDPIAPGITGHMAAAECAPGRRCDPDSVADWESYLGDRLGFNELIAYIGANRSRYAADANVVFVGDSSDAVTQMVRPAADGRLSDGPALTAVRHLFAKGGRPGFAGKIFMNGYDTVKLVAGSREHEGGREDIGRSLYFVDGSGVSHLLPQSKRIWEDWPAP